MHVSSLLGRPGGCSVYFSLRVSGLVWGFLVLVFSPQKGAVLWGTVSKFFFLSSRFIRYLLRVSSLIIL